MQKKLLISAVLALILIGGAVLVWEKKNSQVVSQKPEQAQVDVRNREDSKVFVIDVDPEVSHWQTKETELFTIKFPKEWYWSEASPSSGFTPDGIITNNPNHPIQYPEIGVDNLSNDTEVIIGYELLFASAEDIVTVGVEDVSPVERCKFLSNTESMPLIKSCEQKYADHQVERVYNVIYKSVKISLNVRTTDNTLVSNDTLEKIARSIVLTNGQ